MEEFWPELMWIFTYSFSDCLRNMIELLQIFMINSTDNPNLQIGEDNHFNSIKRKTVPPNQNWSLGIWFLPGYLEEAIRVEISQDNPQTWSCHCIVSSRQFQFPNRDASMRPFHLKSQSFSFWDLDCISRIRTPDLPLHSQSWIPSPMPSWTTPKKPNWTALLQ